MTLETLEKANEIKMRIDSILKQKQVISDFSKYAENEIVYIVTPNGPKLIVPHATVKEVIKQNLELLDDKIFGLQEALNQL